MDIFLLELNDPWLFLCLSVGNHPEVIPPKAILSVDTRTRGSRSEVSCYFICYSLLYQTKNPFIFVSECTPMQPRR